MESTLATLIKIAKVSQELITALTHADSRGANELEVSRLLFLLNKIVSSSRGIVELLNRCMIESTTPDEQLGGWISANGPVICLLALNEMKKTVCGTDDARKTHFNILPSIFNSASSEREKIREVVEVFDNHQNHFAFLLMSDGWDHGMDSLHHAIVATVPFNLHVQNPSALHAFGHQTRSKVMTNHADPSASNGPKVQLNLESLDAVLRWLDAFRCLEKHVDTLLQRQSDTCTWLLKATEYNMWLGAGEGSLLWLHGKGSVPKSSRRDLVKAYLFIAGSGKSVLIAATIEHLENCLVDNPLAFFYCDFAKEESTDAAQVIRSLIYQLLDQYRHRNVKPGALQVIDELAGETRKGDAIHKNILRLPSLLSRVIEQFYQQPLIIIDALDECKDLDHLLHALLVLRTSGARLLVGSRPIQAIQHKLSGLPSISMDNMAEAVLADIELHVNREVDSHRRLAFLDPTLKRELCSTLCQKADGMFRWVQCQLNALKACVTLREFQETLNNLPVGLEATYERILHGIDQCISEGEVARRALTWLVTASRPLILTEMVEALSIDLQKRKLNPGIAPIHSRALLDALGSLVVHNEETGIINLSHFSVKEYLLDELTRIKLPSYHINLQEAHKQVFQFCMCYLSASLVSLLHNEATQSTQHDTVLFSSMPSLPLLDYVLSCSFDHLAQLEPTDDTVLDSLVALHAEIQEHSPEWKRMCGLASLYHAYKSWITPEHDFIICVLISMLPEPFLRAFLGPKQSLIRIPSYTLYTSTKWTMLGHYFHEVTRTLPLVAALRHDNTTLVDLFLSEGGATVPRQVYSTVFEELSCEYAPRLVSRLLQADDFVEWATQVKDTVILSRPLDHGRYLQHQTTEKDLVVMVRRLVQIGHDFSSEQFLLMVALATTEGRLSLLEYLFRIQAPVPSGILVAEKVVPLVRELALGGINIEAIVANGDATLHEVLRRCFGYSQCWALDCLRCSASRSILLTTLGREDEKTLVKIITVAQRLKTSLRLLATHASTKILRSDLTSTLLIPGVLRQLEKIRLASGSLLQSINNSVLRNIGLDHDAERWLSEKEPKACLEVLEQMMDLAEAHGPDTSTKEQINTLITFLNEQQSHFHFLLSETPEFSNELIEFSLTTSHRSIADSRPQLLSCASAASMSPSSYARRTRERRTQVHAASTSRLDQDSSHREHSTSRRTTLLSITQPARRLSQAQYYLIHGQETSVVFVGQTGVGKSSLINMIMGIPDHSQAAARVGRGACTGTLHNSIYSCTLAADQKCELWDTRGLGPATGDPLMSDTPPRISQGTLLILVWCIHATKVDLPVYWEQLRKTHEEYYKTTRPLLMPMIVVTQMAPYVAGWEGKCRNQIRQLNLLMPGGINICDSVLLLRVRRHRGPSSPEYIEDSRALRYHMSQFARKLPLLASLPLTHLTPFLPVNWVPTPPDITSPFGDSIDGRPDKRRRIEEYGLSPLSQIPHNPDPSDEESPLGTAGQS